MSYLLDTTVISELGFPASTCMAVVQILLVPVTSLSRPFAVGRPLSEVLVTGLLARTRAGRADEARCRPVACELPARGRPRHLSAGWR